MVTHLNLSLSTHSQIPLHIHTHTHTHRLSFRFITLHTHTFVNHLATTFPPYTVCCVGTQPVREHSVLDQRAELHVSLLNVCARHQNHCVRAHGLLNNCLWVELSQRSGSEGRQPAQPKQLHPGTDTPPASANTHSVICRRV